jgi:hypothetical protein
MYSLGVIFTVFQVVANDIAHKSKPGLTLPH